MNKDLKITTKEGCVGEYFSHFPTEKFILRQELKKGGVSLATTSFILCAIRDNNENGYFSTLENLIFFDSEICVKRALSKLLEANLINKEFHIESNQDVYWINEENLENLYKKYGLDYQKVMIQGKKDIEEKMEVWKTNIENARIRRKERTIH